VHIEQADVGDPDVEAAIEREHAAEQVAADGAAESK
jgi:hypothetical protein